MGFIDTSFNLKWGHPSNQDTLIGPKGGWIRRESTVLAWAPILDWWGTVICSELPITWTPGHPCIQATLKCEATPLIRTLQLVPRLSDFCHHCLSGLIARIIVPSEWEKPPQFLWRTILDREKVPQCVKKKNSFTDEDLPEKKLHNVIYSPLQTTMLDAPISRVKFVCHDKHDAQTFAAVIQQPASEETFLPYRIFCFQAEMKIVSWNVNLYS